MAEAQDVSEGASQAAAAASPFPPHNTPLLLCNAVHCRRRSVAFAGSEPGTCMRVHPFWYTYEAQCIAAIIDVVVPPDGWCANDVYRPAPAAASGQQTASGGEDEEGEDAGADEEGEDADARAAEAATQEEGRLMEKPPVPACLVCMTEAHRIFTKSVRRCRHHSPVCARTHAANGTRARAPANNMCIERPRSLPPAPSLPVDLAAMHQTWRGFALSEAHACGT